MQKIKRVRVTILLIITVISITFAPFLVGHVRNAMNSNVFNDDVRQQIFPYYRYTENNSSGQDILGDYILAIMPVGINFVYRSAAHYVDPEILSKVFPYLLYIVTLVGLAMTARKLGGPFLMLAVLALIIQTPTFLDRMTGGLSRAFGFPVLSLALWALVAGKIRVLAVLVAVGAAFYPASGAVLGIILAIVLILIPDADRGEAQSWSWKRRVVVLLVCGAVSIAVLLPTILTTSQWGRPLGPGDQVSFPESGLSGRYGANSWPDKRYPLQNLFAEVLAETQRALSYQSDPIAPGIHELIKLHNPFLLRLLLFYLLICSMVLATQKGRVRRLLALPTAGTLGYLFAETLAPYVYLPQRYITLTLPLTFVLFLPAGTAQLARLLVPVKWANRAKQIGGILASVTIIVFFGGRGNPMTGYTVVLDSHTNIYEFIRGLPKESIIAGWPTGVVDNIPYCCRRRAFLTYENHHALHERYTLETRMRMNLLIGALFSEDPTFLATLRDKFGVTHLIIESDNYVQPPAYFEPFDLEIRAVWQTGAAVGFAINKLQNKDAAVFQEGKLSVLDLSMIRTNSNR